MNDTTPPGVAPPSPAAATRPGHHRALPDAGPERMNISLFPSAKALAALHAILAAFPPCDGNGDADRWTAPVQRTPVLRLLFRPSGRLNTFSASDLDAALDALGTVGWAMQSGDGIRFKIPTKQEALAMDNKFSSEWQRCMRLAVKWNGGPDYDARLFDAAKAVIEGDAEMSLFLAIRQLCQDAEAFNAARNGGSTPVAGNMARISLATP